MTYTDTQVYVDVEVHEMSDAAKVDRWPRLDDEESNAAERDVDKVIRLA